MKYIRTKDGRIIDLDRIVYGNKVFHLNENEIENDSWSGWYWYTEEYGYELECRDLDILRQADTIEELCDEFRGVWKNYYESEKKDAHEEYHYNKEKNVFYDDFEELTHKEAIEKFDIFYGAIWTSKGLIYVAKMNDKGEFELL